MKLSSPLIGLGGKLRSGKDAVADYLVAEHGYIKLGMSDALHEAMLAIDPLIPVEIELSRLRAWVARFVFGRSETLFTFERYSTFCRRVGYVEAKTNAEVRRLLQKLGTEVGRNMIDENVWVNIMARKIDDHRGAGHPVVVTGIRFPNEAQMLRELAGHPVWVERPDYGESTSAAAHDSEKSVSAADFDEVIVNDGTLEDLAAKAEDLAARL